MSASDRVNVWLVGAGPGDPGLITRRGLELLRSCDVVLFDRLVDPRLMDEAPDAATRVFVGKRPGEPSMPQAAIDALIVEHASSGKRVVRLKGGDPFVFGRGADEAQALAAAGIPFEIVPGVSSATAVPGYAGIPVTHSGMSSSFAVLTAHASAHRPEAEERWQELVRGADTLVLMMGVAGLKEIAERLIATGRDPNEPAAVIERGTTVDQRTVVGTLGEIAELARGAAIEPPAITIVGPVVRLRDALNWFESRPLFGVRVVVTRPRAQALELADELEQRGATVLLVPTIRIDDPPSWTEADAALDELDKGGFEWVVFSSANGVEKTFARIAARGSDARIFGSARIAAVGPATEKALSERGLRADLIPQERTAEALVEALGPGSGRVLVPRPAEAPTDVLDRLAAAGWKPLGIPVYRTSSELLIESPDAHEVKGGNFDVLTLASGSAAQGFVEAFGEPSALGLGMGGDPAKQVVCIGPSTAQVAEELGFRIDGVAPDHTGGGLADEIEKGIVRSA